jgi:hypothetical protein
MIFTYIYRILIIIFCSYALIIQIMRIIWQYFPGFIKDSFIYKHKQPSKFELMLYFLAMFAILAYTFYSTLHKIL